ncbi:MAG: glucoamylase [Rhodospirillaceae bacterium]|nr:MAG: glucoamylase [Rhodospirillaceae bacterium]
MIVRRIRPVQGCPRLLIWLRPRFENSGLKPYITIGSNHIRYVSPAQTLRLTTNATISYIIEEHPFSFSTVLSTCCWGVTKAFRPASR